MRKIVFTGVSCDPRYGYESYYLKSVTATGLKQVAGDTYLLVGGEWIEVEVDSVKIFDSNNKQ